MYVINGVSFFFVINFGVTWFDSFFEKFAKNLFEYTIRMSRIVDIGSIRSKSHSIVAISVICISIIEIFTNQFEYM